MSRSDTFHWLDIERIAEELVDQRDDIDDPLTVSFPRLKALVAELEGFREQTGHPCNEKILEAIQSAWIEELRDARTD